MMTRTLLCYGDSNTHGTMPMEGLEEMRRFGPAERWPGVMTAELGAGWHVIEEGLPGRTTVHADPVAGAYKNGLAFLPAILESHRPIDLVVLMLGTNDLKCRFQVPPVEIGESVAQLILTVQHSTAGPGGAAPKLLLVCPPPVLEAGCLGDIFEGGEQKSKKLGPVYSHIAARHDVAFLDAGTVIVSSPVDGVHFDAPEHVKLGRAVAATVKAMMP